MKNPQLAIQLLNPWLSEEGPGDDGEWPARCPFHEDTKPSASFNFESGLWFCFAGCPSGRIVDAIDRLKDAGDIVLGDENVVELDAVRIKATGKTAEVSETEVANRHFELLKNDARMMWLEEHRGLNPETVRRFRLGWHAKRRSYTVPIYNDREKLVNIRYYCPGQPEYKWRNSEGHGGSVLYPISFLENGDQSILICEGEMDALLAIQHGYRAVTGTGGAKRWMPEWNSRFFGRDVYIVYDRDKTGVDGALKVASNLQPVANSVNIIDLPYSVEKAGGKDLTDYLVVDKHSTEDFQKLLADSIAVDPFNLEDTLPKTDLGNAERLAERHGHEIRYVPPWHSWLVFREGRWQVDTEGLRVRGMAVETIRALKVQAASMEDSEDRDRLIVYALKCESSTRLDAMLKEARSLLAVNPDHLDQDSYLFNCQNGTLNLKTEELQDFNPKDLITKMAGVAFDRTTKAPRWEQFVEEVLPDKDDQDYLRRAVGYSLTGNVSEQVLFILWGAGSNGKSLMFETIKAVFGDYGQTAPSDMLVAKSQSRVSNDIARLKGVRFVTTSETETNKDLAEGIVKEITGEDTIVARQLYQEFFEFKPTHKVWFATNHKPNVKGGGAGIWRRLRLIPFTQTFPLNKQLKGELLSQLPGILNWALEGLFEWREDGLQESLNVRLATSEYRQSEDYLGQFLDEACELGSEYEVAWGDLCEAYEDWALLQGLKPITRMKLIKILTERGFEKVRTGHGRETRRKGLRLKEGER